MEKKALVGMGLTEEQAEQVMGALDGAYVPKDRFNEVNTALKQAKESLKERDGQLETLKGTTGDQEALQRQIADLQAQNKAAEEAHAAELTKVKVDAIVERALLQSNARNAKAARALLADVLDSAEVDGDTVKGLDAAIQKLKDGEDTKFLFAEDKGPVFKGVTPGERRDGVPDPVLSQYQARLDDARKNRDNVAAINIKQEAHKEGIILT